MEILGTICLFVLHYKMASVRVFSCWLVKHALKFLFLILFSWPFMHFSESHAPLQDSSLSVCVAVLSNRPGIFLETCGARGNYWACSDALNRSLSTVLQVPASIFPFFCVLPLIIYFLLHVY